MPPIRDQSAAENHPGESWQTASALWVDEEEIWRTVFARAEITDAHEVGLYLRYGETAATSYFDPTAAAILGEQLIAASRAATAQATP